MIEVDLYAIDVRWFRIDPVDYAHHPRLNYQADQ